jgi:hypothetical protein
MKIKDGYIVRKIGTKYYAVSVSQVSNGGGMIALNETGAFIWDLMKAETDADTIASALAAHYEIDVETAKRDTEAFIGMLKEAGALA